MSPVVWLIVYCLLILAASVAGGLIPIYIRLTHRRMELALSFISGVMLGIGVLHLLPHAWEECAEAAGGESHAVFEGVMLWLLAGFLAMFLIERFFSFHQHPPEHDEHGRREDGGTDRHEHHHHHHAHGITWTGATIGLSLHSLLAGIALAGSMQAGTHGGESAALAGFGTFLVIFLHKPFDAMAIGTLMSVEGRSLMARHIVNALFALAIPLGAGLLYAGLSAGIVGRHELIGAALAFSAGMFICIALSDLLPELQFHQHDRLMLSAALLLGLALAWGIARLEAAGHEHDGADGNGEHAMLICRSRSPAI